jgi:hypothetical protein
MPFYPSASTTTHTSASPCFHYETISRACTILLGRHREHTMEAHIQQSEDFAYDFDSSQFEDSEAFLHDMLKWERSLAPPQPMLPSPEYSQVTQEATERLSQPADDSVITGVIGIQTGSADTDSLEMFRRSLQDIQWVVVEKGQNHCPICNTTFKGTGSAVRAVSTYPSP